MNAPAPHGFNLRELAVPVYGPALFFGAAEGALLPVIPELSTGRGASLAMAAFVAMLLGLGSFVFNVPAGLITERCGERAALIGAGLVGIIGCAIAMLPHLGALMVGLFILGLAQSVYLLARQKYLAEAVAPNFRARALSLLAGVMRVGVFVGPLLGAFAVARWGVGSAMICAAAFLVIATACAAIMADLDSTTDDDQARQRIRTSDVAREHAHVLKTVGTGILLVQAVRAIRQVVIPLWCVHSGLNAHETSLVYAISAGVDMLVFYPAGKVMDVRGRAWVAVPAMTIMGLALAVMPLTHSFGAVLASSCLLGFGNGIGSGMVMTLGADFSPNSGRATFLGLWRQLGDTGSMLGPLALSGVTALVGLAPAVVGSAVLGFAAASMLGFWPAHLEKQGWGRGKHPA